MGPRAFSLVLSVILGLLAVGARAERTAPDHRAAAAHFARGLDFVRTGAVADALAEFRRAEELEDNFAVRYNIGQALVSLGRSAEATRELRRYLDEGGERIAPERKKQVQADLIRLAENVGLVRVSATPPGASVSIDGVSVGVSPLAEALTLDAGQHWIEGSYAGHIATRSVAVRGGTNQDVDLDLTEPAAVIAPRATGEIAVACAIPGVVVDLDGQPVTRTGSGCTLFSPEGTHRVSFHRAGYRATDRTVTVKAGQTTPVKCGIEPVSPPDAAHTGKLVVQPSEPSARVEVDGGSHHELLPEGLHSVRISKPGFVVFDQLVDVPAGGAARVDAKLLPTAAELRRYQARASSERAWAYALGAAGLATGAAGAIVYVWNDARHGTWQDRKAGLDAEWATLPPHSADLVARQTANDELIGSIHDADRVGLGLGIGAVVSLAGSAILFLGGADPGRFDAVAGGGRWSTEW